MLQCWGGFNYHGQIGTGNTNDVDAPTWVVGIREVTKLELGDDTTCAIVKSGALYCWGVNKFLKADSRQDIPAPTQVPGLSHVVDVSVGDGHACAVDAAGDVYCWGRNSDGEIGAGEGKIGSDVNEPTRVLGVSDVIGVAAARSDTFVWTRGGDVYRWGSAGGQPIRPWAAPRPRKVLGVSGVTRVVAMGEQACALTAEKQVRCFILESLEALAAGKQFDLGPEALAFARAFTRRKNIQLPKLIYPDAHELRGVADLLVFHHDASALTESGEVYSWGNGERGTINRSERTKGLWPPTRITGLADVAQLAGGFMHRCALKKDGSVYCFGGSAPTRSRSGSHAGFEIPMPIAGLPKIKRIAANDHCTFALAEDDTLWAFGDSWINACGAKETDTIKFDTPRQVPLDTRPPS